MKQQIGIIIGMFLLLSVVSAEVISISPEVLYNIDLHGGESTIQNLTINTSGNYLVYLDYNIYNNTYDSVGLTIEFENPIQVNLTKTIPITISVLPNFNPDSFKINFTASTEKAEEQIKEIFVQNQTTKIVSGENNLTLDINSTGSGNITVVPYKFNPEKAHTKPSLDIFFYINISESIRTNMSETKIRVSYTDTEVNAMGIVESTLRLHFFNESSDSWQEQQGGVNISGNYVWADTDHFSLWGLFGNSIPASTTPSSSGGGGGGGSSYVPVSKNVTNETDLDEKTNESLEDEEEKSIVEQGKSLITGAVTGINDNISVMSKETKRIVGAIGFALILILIFSLNGGSPFASPLKKAAVFHKRAQKAHIKGNYAKADRLYNKSYELREKGEEKIFRRS